MGICQAAHPPVAAVGGISRNAWREPPQFALPRTAESEEAKLATRDVRRTGNVRTGRIGQVLRQHLSSSGALKQFISFLRSTSMNRLYRSSNRRTSVSLAALSAAAMLAATATQSSAQTWVNPSTGNWSVGANWVGGIAPSSGPATALVFNAAAADTYSATNDVANPFEFATLTANNSGTGAINITGNAF